ncbi:hypothetical protein HYX09_05580 [Candidatus Woesearchaeota archaeon]|nr:hypothetical protein [Candidatus Woesearchaeota archaeon]
MRRLWGILSGQGREQKPTLYDVLVSQPRYDREIRDGWSTGLVRFATLDLTELPYSEVRKTLERIADSVQDTNMGPSVIVTEFISGGRRYVAIRGETHRHYVGDAQMVILSKMRKVTDGIPVTYVTRYIEISK